MITERDKSAAEGTKSIIKASSLDTNLKSDLCEAIDESLINLNGRTIEEKVQSIAQAQFTHLRLLCNILCDVYHKEKTWKDVVAECKWGIVILGGIISIACIFQPQIISIIEKFVN